MQPNGNPPGPSIGAVIANPNLTVRASESGNEDITRKGNEVTYRYSYEYDSHHNWTKRTMSLVKKTDQSTTLVPIKITYRAIAYYIKRQTCGLCKSGSQWKTPNQHD